MEARVLNELVKLRPEEGLWLTDVPEPQTRIRDPSGDHWGESSEIFCAIRRPPEPCARMAVHSTSNRNATLLRAVQ